MNKRTIIVIVFIIAVIAVVAALMLSSYGKDAGYTDLNILGNGTIDENGTVDIKLTSWEGDALKDKDLHVSLKDSEGNIVFKESAKTHDDGIASVEFINVSSGEYTINVTYDGDENYSSASLSEKLIIGEIVEEEEDNSTNETDEITDDENLDDTYDTYDYGSSSSSYNSYSSPSSSSYSDYSDSGSSSDGGGSEYYDENGNPVDSVVDEGGSYSSEE